MAADINITAPPMAPEGWEIIVGNGEQPTFSAQPVAYKNLEGDGTEEYGVLIKVGDKPYVFDVKTARSLADHIQLSCFAARDMESGLLTPQQAANAFDEAVSHVDATHTSFDEFLKLLESWSGIPNE